MIQDFMVYISEFWTQIIINLVGSIKTIRLADVLDIALVAFLVYHAIKLVMETRAAQLVKGIIAILLLYIFSAQLGMRTMNFIMENVFNVGLIVIAIVFQPEIRRALDQMGRTKISKFNVFSNSTDEKEVVLEKWTKTINAICESADQLSKDKIGALIVVERQTKVGDVIKTGTPIDAYCTKELIENVFFPNSPMHDGAMVIRDARVFAAGCFLPLSENFEISKELGTRHRASLGMSEVSDSVIIVVSEETGRITVAMDGKLNRNYNKEKLLKKLKLEIIGNEETDDTKKKNIFRRKSNEQKI